VGSLGGAAAFWGTYYLADEAARLVGTNGGWTTGETAVSVGVSLILMLVVVVLGAPLRPEEDTVYEEDETPEG
jgi:hypothetical protein